jgi:hypothetical protein
MALSSAAHADFELTGPDGRRILLKDNGTWQYVEAKEKARANDAIKDAGEAQLVLESKTDRGTNCRFTILLINSLPYQIRSFVPYFSAFRANGVLHDTVSSPSSFAVLRPGDRQLREVEFTGIACQDIARLQVVGGDRCEMGELNKFSEAKGQCLARVRVERSDLVRFDK